MDEQLNAFDVTVVGENCGRCGYIASHHVGRIPDSVDTRMRISPELRKESADLCCPVENILHKHLLAFLFCFPSLSLVKIQVSWF